MLIEYWQNTEDVSDLNHHNGKEKHDAVPSVIIDSKMVLEIMDLYFGCCLAEFLFEILTFISMENVMSIDRTQLRSYLV